MINIFCLKQEIKHTPKPTQDFIALHYRDHLILYTKPKALWLNSQFQYFLENLLEEKYCATFRDLLSLLDSVWLCYSAMQLLLKVLTEKNIILNSMLLNIYRKKFCLFSLLKLTFFYGMAHLSMAEKPMCFIPKFAKLGARKGAQSINHYSLLLFMWPVFTGAYFQVHTATKQPQYFYNTVKQTFNKTFLMLTEITTHSMFSWRI